MHSKLSFLVNLIQADCFIQFSLTLDNTGVALLIHPLDGELLVRGEPTDVPHLLHEVGEGHAVVDVGDKDLAIVGGLDSDLRNIAVIEPLVGLSRVQTHLV